MVFKQVEVSELKEHPRNREHFEDIADESKAQWEHFIRSVEEHGIIEPVIVNAETMEIISGNQRWKAAKYLGMKTIPAVLKDADDPDKEVRQLIASNVMRRIKVDPFVLMEYINQERAGYDPDARDHGDNLHDPPTRANLSQRIGADRSVITAASRFRDLDPDEQERIKKWYAETHPTQEQLTKEIAEARKQLALRDAETDDYEAEIKKKQAEIAELKKSQSDYTDEVKKLKGDIKELRKQAKATDLEVQAKILESRVSDISREAKSLAAQISTFLKTFEKLVGKDADMQGIGPSIVSSDLSLLAMKISELQSKFDIKLIKE